MEDGRNELLEGLGAVGYARGWPFANCSWGQLSQEMESPPKDAPAKSHF